MTYLVGKFFKYKNKPEALYAHGHLQEPIKYRLETDREVGGPGLPVTIGASKINSYVLGYSGFATGYTWTSTSVNGIAHLLPVSEDFKEERLEVMNNILEGFIPERSTHIRPIGDDLKYISIIRIDVNEKKSHTHGIPAALGFELKTDVEDKAVVDAYWEGAIPVWQAYGAPIKGDREKKDPPKYLTTFVEQQTKKNHANAEAKAREKWPYDPIEF